MKISRKFIEEESWAASILFLTGYILVTQGIVSPQSMIYNLLCVLGGLGFVWYGAKRNAHAIVFFNALYAAIALFRIVSLLI